PKNARGSLLRPDLPTSGARRIAKKCPTSTGSLGRGGTWSCLDRRRRVAKSRTLLGEEFHSPDENEGAILTNGKMDHQGPEAHRANLHLQVGQTIRWLAGIKGIEFQAAYDLPKSPQKRFAAALTQRFTMSAADGCSCGSRAMNFVTARTITWSGHSSTFSAVSFSLLD